MKYSRKLIAVVLSVLMVYSAAPPEIGHSLAPSLSISSEDFKELFIARSALLAHEVVNGFIKEYLREQVGGKTVLDGLTISRKDFIKVAGENGENKQEVLIVGIEGLLENTGQLAHVGLGTKNGMPTIYVDNRYFYNETILRHEKDEIAGWESERLKRGLSYSGMREWIKKHIKVPEPETGKTSREIADAIHAASYGVDNVYAEIRQARPEIINYKRIYQQYLRYPVFDVDDNDVNISSGPGSDASVDQLELLREELSKIARDPRYGFTPEKIDNIISEIEEGEIELSGEDLDIISVDEYGRESILGKVDTKIAHKYGLMHRTANVFVIMPNGKIIVQRRTHNKVEPFKLTIPGGHVISGSDYIDTARQEVLEELGLPKGLALQGRFHAIGKPRNFESGAGGQKNLERRGLYFYMASSEEAASILENKEALEIFKKRMSREEFAMWIENQQRGGSLYGETWGIHEFTLEQLTEIAEGNGPGQALTEIYADGAEEFSAELSTDLLAGLLLDKEVHAAVKNAIETLAISRQDIEDNLKRARAMFSVEHRDDVLKIAGKALTDIKKILSVGCDKDGVLLALYYKACIMENMMKGFEGETGMANEDSVQIFVLGADRQKVLLQKRGDFKRSFPGKLTVSANVKPKEGRDIREFATKAVEKEVGITPDASRFISPEHGNIRQARFIGFSFVPFTPEEEEDLENVYELMAKGDFGEGIVAEWHKRKRALNLYSVDSSCTVEKVREVAEKIRKFTGIEPLYPALNDNRASTLAYVLTPKEERQVKLRSGEKQRAKEAAEKAILDSMSQEILRNIDSDDMFLKGWTRLKENFENDPGSFALDLVAPHFSDEAFWEALFPSVISVDDDMAELISVSGGKGANTHILRKLISSEEITHMKVPEASVVTTYAYQRVVLGDPDIREDIETLEKEKDETRIRIISERIRRKIEAIDLPEDLKEIIEENFHRLGRDLYVRSSATVEDLKEFAAAGLAESYPHITNAEDVQEAVKKVWASLFSEGFVNARIKIGLSHEKALMGVMLQRSIDPKASGVVFTINSDERPIFNISAQPGAGEGIVQGKGTVDTWRVGFLADTILERTIPHKKFRVVTLKEGGTQEEEIDSIEPCMSDDEVLDVARAVKFIQKAYRKRDLAENVDVEFVVDDKGNLYVVQARAKASFASEIKNEAVFVVTVVDEKNVPEDTEIIELSPNSSIANFGAVTARLQIVVDDSGERTGEALDKHLASITKPGVILVTHHTNNEFNGVFSKLAGVITTDGNLTSHAAQNSSPLKIPCLVGAADAITKLQKFDGQIVTIDTGKRKVYLGEMPIVEQKRSLKIWSANTDDYDITAVHQKEPHEIFQRWETTRARREEVFKNSPEDGHLRHRSNFLRKFQMDYYWRAWDRLTDFLNSFFGDRAPWILETQDRVIKWRDEKDHDHIMRLNPDDKTVRYGLEHRIVRNDPKSVFYFIQNAKDISEQDLQAIFDARWKGFQTFSEFMNATGEITKTNVEECVGQIIDIFMWMHIGFWLDVTVTHLFAHDQFRYVTPEYANILKEEAAKSLPAEESIDVGRDDVPFGKTLKLSRVKDRKITALVEKIWSMPDLAESFIALTNTELQGELSKRYPGILREIQKLSLLYKAHSEHLDELSDTDGYLKDIRGRVKEGTALKDEYLAALCMAYLDAKGRDEMKGIFDEMKEENAELYSILRGYLRVGLAQGKTRGNWKEVPLEERIRALVSVRVEELEEGLPGLASRIDDLIRMERSKIEVARNALNEYPRLKYIAALAQQEFLLREDAHHLIVPLQRKFASMMLEVAQRYTDVLGDPRRIFDISTDEFIALLREDAPRYIALTFEREYELNLAEKKLTEEWVLDPMQAADNYSASLVEIYETLDKQIASATIDRVKKSYDEEKKRLEEREKWLRDTILLMELSELLNKRDATRATVSADVLLICGNDTLDVFSEAVKLYAEGRVRKILISGGLGKGTLSLIRSALLERIPVRISKNEIISHESQVARLERLNREGKLKTVLKVSEADIIRQIMIYMAENHRDEKGNEAKISLNHDDILCEGKTTNIVEYFTNSRSILYRLRDELSLKDHEPLTVAYMHDGLIQTRTKSLFETIYQADINSGAIKGISYTLDQDIFELRRDAVEEAMLREMFAMVIFSRAGHVVMDFDGKKGLSNIPEKYWRVAADILDNYPNKEKIRNLFISQINGLRTKESWFPDDMSNIVARLPESAQIFGASLLRLFGQYNGEEERKGKTGEEKKVTFADVLRIIRDNGDLMEVCMESSPLGITSSDIADKMDGVPVEKLEPILDVFKKAGILRSDVSGAKQYKLSRMIFGSSDRVKSIINAIADMRWGLSKDISDRPMESEELKAYQMNSLKELFNSTVIHQMNGEFAPSTAEKTIIYIVSDSILPEGQRGALKKLEQEMRGREYSEKIVYLPTERITDPLEFMAAVDKVKVREEARYSKQGHKVTFYVACPYQHLVAEVQKHGMHGLAFSNNGGGDIAQMEGIMLALRALSTGKIENLLAAYRIVTGIYIETDTKDINELAQILLFILPAAKLDIEDIVKLNRIITENIKTAA